MRIIAGRLKGRRLFTPSDGRIRPTTDKVKEAIFSMICGYIDGDSVCIDLFCGTGSLGLEAISRGAKSVYFCDRHRESLALSKANIHRCGAENQAVLLLGDFASSLARIGQKADVIFLDPPYGERMIGDCLARIAEYGSLSPQGIIVAEHERCDVLPDACCGFQRIKEKRYGAVSVSVYGFPEAEKDEE